MDTTNNAFNLIIKDYQIIKKASLSFLPGLNCIIGQSNNGKSAILRATKAVIYNTPGTTSIRNGCSSYAVGVQANGHNIILQKGTNSTYKVDSTVMNKIGRVQIPEVAEALGIKELNINGSNEEINFLDQMEKPFLLDRSETELFRFIVDSGKDSNVTQALKTLTQDRQQLTRDITVTEGRLAQIEQQIKEQEASLSGADDKIHLYDSVIELGPKIKRSKEVTALTVTVGDIKKSLDTLHATEVKLSGALSLTSTGEDIISNSVKKYNLLDKLVLDTNKIIESKTSLETKLRGLSDLDTTELEGSYNLWTKVSKVADDCRNITSSLNELKSKIFPEVGSDFNDDLKKLNTVSNILSSIKSDFTLLKSQKEKVSGIQLDIEAAEKEINELGVCPICGNPLHVG